MRIFSFVRDCFVLCMMFVLLSTTCLREGNLAANGKCIASLAALPDDSVYSVMSYSLSSGESRIEQLVKPISPALIRSQDITISLMDSIDIAFDMLDIWGNKIDSIYITEPTFIAFEIKKQRNSNAVDLKNNLYVRLVERTDNGSVIFLFDFNKRHPEIIDKRYKEIREFCHEHGAESKIPRYANRNSLIFVDDEWNTAIKRE